MHTSFLTVHDYCRRKCSTHRTGHRILRVDEDGGEGGDGGEGEVGQQELQSHHAAQWK